MKKERYWPVLGKWMKDTVTTPPDPQQTAHKVAEQIAQTPQVRHRWWLPSMRRTRTHSSGSEERIAHQPSPIPATRGHTPTATGRTQSMFSPVKAIAAGALVFAIGGAFLISQPFNQQPAVPGAETEAIAPTWVTGDVEFAPTCSGPEIVIDGDVRHAWNYECSPQTWTTSDPRLTGKVSKRWNEDVYETDEGVIAVNTSTAFLRNDGGGWVCPSSNLYKGFGLFPEGVTGETATCVGEGGYEGLSALLVFDAADVAGPLVGIIFSGDFPPLPEPPAAE